MKINDFKIRTSHKPTQVVVVAIVVVVVVVVVVYETKISPTS